MSDGVLRLCRSLKSVNIPDKVTIIGAEAFAGAASAVSKCQQKPHKGMAMHFGCAIGEHKFTQSRFCNRNNAFSNCRSLKRIIIPDSVKDLGSSTFIECQADITLPNGIDVTERKYSQDVKFSGGEYSRKRQIY